MAEEQRGLAVESESIEALAGRDVVEPTAATGWTQEEAHRRKAAPLRMYLGSAPGVGKTYAMLSEGHRRLDRGTDVVVGFVGPTAARRRSRCSRASGSSRCSSSSTGVAASRRWTSRRSSNASRRSLCRRAGAHEHPRRGHAKRWEDVIDTPRGGIEVITTVNIQHLESLNDVIANVTGIRQQETDPRLAVRPGRSGRARRHVAARAPATDAARERLPGRSQVRARAPAVLHDGEPDGAPRARADEGREPGRRRPCSIGGRRTGPATDVRERVLVCVSRPGELRRT